MGNKRFSVLSVVCNWSFTGLDDPPTPESSEDEEEEEKDEDEDSEEDNDSSSDHETVHAKPLPNKPSSQATFLSSKVYRK